MNIEKQTPVAEIATQYPLATRVLARHQIGYCCEGGKSLAEACQKRDLDVDTIIAEIHTELEKTIDSEKRWDQTPLNELIDHILTTYHESLREELPRLETMARRVEQVHGEKMPLVLPQLAQVVSDLRLELEQHMMKEEQILFPLIRQGESITIECPIKVMQQEHDSASAALQHIRELTNNYTVPDGACNTWQALWHGLAALEQDLQHHIHLENNILFPRALKVAAV
ncbi:MAG: iron-sulfur cluster repair di-iron protein [Verrucomicrobiales bacterium]|nr:iron-sulfur cluster repair di-iron protein [Verrucomicrobiales bacterium]